MTARRALLGLVLSCAFATACSAPNHLEGSLYQDGRVAFRIPALPDGWARIDVSEANLAFRDDAHEASILVDGRCNRRDEDAPLSALAEHLIIGTTARDFVSQETIPFDAREAMHTVMVAKLDGVAMQYDIYVLEKDGCVYDLVYVAPPARFAEGAPRFEQFALGLHTVGAGGL